MAKVNVISGFLGAGKTTLINKLPAIATLAVLLGFTLTACSSALTEDDQLAEVRHTIEFAAAGCEGNAVEQLEDRVDMDVKAPRLIHTASGEEYKLRIVSSGEGAIAYTFETVEETVNLSEFQVSTPVQYVEKEAAEKIKIPLSESSEWIEVTVNDSSERFPNAGKGVLMEFTSQRMESLPYNMVLVSGGEVYENPATSYQFDNLTGDFTDGYLIFLGLTVEEISEDAYLETTSVLDRYELTNFSLME